MKFAEMLHFGMRNASDDLASKDFTRQRLIDESMRVPRECRIFTVGSRSDTQRIHDLQAELKTRGNVSFYCRYCAEIAFSFL